MSRKTTPAEPQEIAGSRSPQTDEVSFEDKEAATAPQICDTTLQKQSVASPPPKKSASAEVAASSPSLPTRDHYSKPIARRICEELSKGRTLKAVCASSTQFPLPHIVRKWALDDVDGFAAPYARARELGFLTMADELIDIVDQEDGNITRDKLRVDTRKWLLSKAMPKGFGETPDVKAAVKIGFDETDYEMGKKIAFALELSSRGVKDKED